MSHNKRAAISELHKVLELCGHVNEYNYNNIILDIYRHVNEALDRVCDIEEPSSVIFPVY